LKGKNMATVKYGAGIIQMSGSIAGVVHARNRFGNYIRPRTKPVNPRSSNQQVIRTAMKFFTERWHDTLDATMRGTWNTWAAAVSYKNRLGEVVYITGFNAYLGYNIFRSQMENSKADSCLGPPAKIEGDTGFNIAAYTSTQKISVTWTAGLPWTGIAASILGIFQGQPQIATRNFFNGPWRKCGSIPGNQVPPYLMTPAFPLVTGQRIWVYGRIATGPLDGRLSSPMIDDCIVLAAPP
jgi:hypothetical protein